MSAPNKPSSADGALAGSTGRLASDGRRIYRLVPPLVIWWAWVAITVLSLGDLAIQGHDFVSLRFALGWLTATGVVFACTWWPRVITSEDGITVLNPFRTFVVPWGAVRGIFLADSVEVRCARGGGKKDKTVYSWALAAPRRARARAELRGRQQDRGRRSRTSSSDRLPKEARELAKITTAELFARELAQIHERVQGRPQGAERAGAKDGATQEAEPQTGDGSTTAAMSVRWPWPPLTATLGPAVAFAIALLVR